MPSHNTKNQTREEYNEHMRVYMLARYHKQRAAFVERLGGKCAVCGSVDGLEIDHIYRNSKSFDFGKNWSKKKAELEEELKKCQLLCRSHHESKSITDLGLTPAKGTHGTLSAMRYCKPMCEVCCEFNRKYIRDKRAADRAALGLPPSIPRTQAALIHGTKVMYSYHRCRCVICKIANTERSRKYHESKKNKK